MKIICLTEETVETLYLLGREDLILGVSQYVERPPHAKNLPVVTQFIRSDIERIVEMRPDLVIGFSDIQKDIARDLIGRGLNVLITNQRSINEILETMVLVGRMIGEEAKTLKLVEQFREKIERTKEKAKSLPRRPKIYFEEWDHPRYSGIKWVSELIDICGGENIFKDKTGSLAREREVTDEEVITKNPEGIFGCWCGKPVKIDSFKKRYPTTSAVKKDFIWELSPAIFLQPGPALFVDGLDQMYEKIKLVATLDA